MKWISQLFFVFTIVSSCSSQKNTDWNTVSIEYTANSRGMHQKVVVENQKLWVTKNRDEKPVAIPLTTTEWGILKKVFAGVNLETISSLKAPTAKRLYDGAAMANLKIKANGKSYDSKTFDHGFPPKSLEKLVNLLVSYTEK